MGQAVLPRSDSALRLQPLSAARAFWLVALAATAVRLVVVWTGLPETNLISDDAYYYFTIARHVAQGLGPTFDGVAATNGFHPLWMLALVPLYLVMPHSLWLPVRTALSLTVLCDLASGYVIWRLLSPRTGRAVALGAAAAWFVLPPTSLLGLNGMESSLSTLLLLQLLRHLAGARTAGTLWAGRGAVIAGLWLGLCGLARTDNVAAAGLAVAATIVLLPDPLPSSRRLRWLATAAGAAVLVLSPWLVWNLIRFHSIVQVSGQVKLHVRELYGGLPWGWGDPASATLTALHMLFAPVLVSAKYLCGEQFEGGHVALPLALGTQALVVLLVVRGIVARGGGVSRRDLPLVFTATFLIAHTVIYGFVWRSYATWYAHSYGALLIVLLAMLAARSVRRETGAAGGASRLVVAVAAAACLLQLAQYPLFFTRIPLGARGPEKQFRPNLERLQAQAPAGARLGAFDAGALGYVAQLYPGLSVINLDGLVNNEAYAASREGRYADYVLSHVDFVVQDLKRARLFAGPADVARLQRRYGQGPR